MQRKEAPTIVQGYFNDHALPGNLTSLGIFPDRAIGDLQLQRSP